MATVATQVNPVIWFEIPVKDVQRAQKFYQAVFGYHLSATQMGPMAMVMFPMNQVRSEQQVRWYRVNRTSRHMRVRSSISASKTSRER